MDSLKPIQDKDIENQEVEAQENSEADQSVMPEALSILDKCKQRVHSVCDSDMSLDGKAVIEAADKLLQMAKHIVGLKNK